MADALYYPAATHATRFDGKYFFDTNVWLRLQGPLIDPRSDQTINYSNLFKRICEDGGTVWIDPIVVIEYANQFLRMEHKAQIQDGLPSDFKKFRQTEEYQAIARNLADELFHVCNMCEVIGTSLTSDEYDCVAKSLVGSTLDFNDALIIDTCRKSRLTLVTHDYDFAGSDIPIISANWRYK